MKNWLIRKLGGIPLPDEGCWLVVDDVGIELPNLQRESLIKILGAIPLPKPTEGQYLRGPAACKMPVRKAKTTTGTDATTVYEGGIKPVITSEV
jgi:hypothetical protein